MARYTGDYSNDFGIDHRSTSLEVFLMINENKSETSETFDYNYLPPIFLFHILEAHSCSIPIKKRKAICEISVNQYLYIEVPFLPGTIEYNSFFESLVNNLLINNVFLMGEEIQNTYLAHFVR